MAYHRETYHREEDRDRNTGGGWKSWFGLGDDKDKNDYHYQRTTTYRNDDRDRDYNRGSYSGNTGYGGNTSTYVRDERDRGYTGTYGDRYGSSDLNRGYTGSNTDRGYTGGSYGDNRGGYGYQTSNEYNRTADRGYDRDSRDYNVNRDYNRESTYVRNYNSDRDNSTYRPTGADSYSTGRYTSDNRGGLGGNSYTQDYNRGYTGGYGADTSRYNTETSRYGGNTTGDRDRYGGSYSYTQRTSY